MQQGVSPRQTFSDPLIHLEPPSLTQQTSQKSLYPFPSWHSENANQVTSKQIIIRSNDFQVDSQVYLSHLDIFT